MNKIVTRIGLELIDVIKTPIHGNSYIFVIGIKGKAYNIKNLISMESKLTDMQTYVNWQLTVKENMAELKSVIKSYIDQGYKVIGYGAAAKGNTLLNYINQPLDLIIDDSLLKQNMYAPGTNSPIKSIESLKSHHRVLEILRIFKIILKFYFRSALMMLSIKELPLSIQIFSG
jgi:hypothetical protein